MAEGREEPGGVCAVQHRQVGTLCFLHPGTPAWGRCDCLLRLSLFRPLSLGSVSQALFSADTVIFYLTY